MIKKILILLAIVLVGVLFYYRDLVHYGIIQGRGQLSIVWNAEPVEDFLKDPDTPDSVKQKLLFIAEVRKFAVEELGLNDTDNYTTMFDQKGKPILWVVTGCEPFAFKPKLWGFPVVGEMPYKGFFIEEMAYDEMAEVEEDGYDVGLRTVGGWSTLGWFKDPILSNMLGRSYGDLANLIIHELVHATVFVKDSVEFNENLASFIGDRGAELFLQKYYTDTYLVDYEKELRDEQIYISHILRGADELNSLYQSFTPDTGVPKKLALKEEIIEKVVGSMDTLSLSSLSFISKIKSRDLNNTYFMSFLRYRSKQTSLDDLFINEFDKDLNAFIQYMKEKHPFL
ncbi:MAG: aminopeptidase [Bacteroidota bacterium]